MGTLALLLVTAFASGGPAGSRAPVPLLDATVTVARGGVVVASSDFGNLDVALPRGRYEVSASLGPPNVTRARRCQARTVRLNRGTARVRVTLACSIK